MTTPKITPDRPRFMFHDGSSIRLYHGFRWQDFLYTDRVHDKKQIVNTYQQFVRQLDPPDQERMHRITQEMIDQYADLAEWIRLHGGDHQESAIDMLRQLRSIFAMQLYHVLSFHINHTQ